MKVRLQIFAALFLAFALKSNAEDFALLDSEHGISSVEVLEDNIANLEPPDMIQVLAHLKPAPEHSKPETDGKHSSNEPGKKSGKPDDGSKSKSRKSKTKNTSNGDKMKDKNEKPGQEKSKLPKSNQRKDSKTSEKDGKKVDSDATKDEDRGKSGNSTSEKGGKSEKKPKAAKKNKSKDENMKVKGSDSKLQSADKTKDGESSKKLVGSGSDSDKGDKDGKSDDSQKTDSDVIDDKAKMNQDKSESDQSGGKSKKDEKKSVEKFEKPTDDENAGSDVASSKKVDEIPERIKPDKAKKTKEQAVSEAEKASHDVSKDHDDSQAVESKKSKKKKQKVSKKNKRKSKSKKKTAMTEIQKARDGAISNKTPDKTVDSDSETPVNDGSRSYSLESLKHICDVMDEPETAPVSDVSEVDTAMRAFVPILTNKPEMDKSRRRKKKKISAKSKLLFGCDYAKPKDITKFDGKGGITTIYSQASKSRITVYCDNTTLGGGWTVFQRRVDGKLDFDRGYGAYQRGFGELSGEHWLGLDVITNITGKDKYVLRLEMTDAGGKRMIANYGEFSVGSQAKGYRLRIGNFTGIRLPKDVLAIYDGQKFSTFNQDETKSQCGSRLQSGFWFDNCSTSSPNGKYLISSSKSRRPSGIYWKPVAGKFGPITQIEMKFRKKQ